ncbi:MAG: mRNA surveillance protein pelota [Candidatus Micrarchaeia archaeon]
MRITHQDRSENIISLIPENLEDLWHIERVLSPGDVVRAVSFRSFKANEKASSEKKKINLELKAEKIEFARHANRLRITGPIISGTPEEFVQAGSYHTIDIEPGDKLSIIKEWKNFHLTRLKKAIAETKRPRMYVLVMDEKKALLASILGFGVNYNWELENNSSKREDSKRQLEDGKQFFGDILSRIERLEANKIIVAGPGFAAENFAKFAKEKNAALAKRFTLEHCSYAERNGVNELMKKGIISRVAADERVALEMQIMDEFKLKLAKNSDKICYGLKNVKNALEFSAVQKIIVQDELLRNRKDVANLIEAAENNKVEIMIFSHESDGGAELEGFGGLIAFLRFAMPAQQ